MMKIEKKISGAQSRHRVVTLTVGICCAALAFCGWLLLTALIDCRADLPRGVRLVLAAINGILAVYLFVRYGASPAIRGMDAEAVALAVEHMDRRFATRLIAAVQLTRPGAVGAGESTAVVAAMVRETEEVAGGVDFRQAISRLGLQRSGGGVALLFVLSVILFWAGGTRSMPLARRALGMATAWPSRTQIEVLSGDFLVAQGDVATIRARANGYRPTSGLAQIRYADGRTQTIVLSRVSEDEYVGALENVPESFAYKVELFDNASGTFNVSAAARPAVVSLACTQIYPAYTHLRDASREATDLLLLAGSKVRLRITVNRPAVAMDLGSGIVLGGRALGPQGAPTVSVKLQPDATDDKIWTAEFEPTVDVTGFSIHLIDAAGIASRNEVFYPIRLVADKPPVIRMVLPQARQVLAIAEATCQVSFSAADDFGLESVSLHYRVGDGAEVVVPFDVPAAQKEFRSDYKWHLNTVAVPAGQTSLEGSIVEFYVEARDNNATKAGVSSSEHYQVRIVSKADKQAELFAQTAGVFSGIQELKDKQDKESSQLRALNLGPPAATQQEH